MHRNANLPALIVAGCLPPVDTSVELTTITPDPAVIEINPAPSVDAEGFLRRSREIYAAAAGEGLCPYRHYFNGAVADSGDGGHTGRAPRPLPVSSCCNPCCCRLGLGEAIRAVLVRDEFRMAGQVHLPGCTLEVRRALELWPPVGDAASPGKDGT